MPEIPALPVTVARGAAMLPPDDATTLVLAPAIQDQLGGGTIPNPTVVLRPDAFGHLSIEVEAILVAEDPWNTGVRFRWSRSGSLEVLIDDDYFDSCPMPQEQRELDRFLSTIGAELIQDYARCRARYCTGSLDQDDALIHHADDGPCPLHPDAELV